MGVFLVTAFLYVFYRSRVDGLRRERLLFDEVLRKADRDWVAQKAEMVSLIKATSVAHDQRQKVGRVAARTRSCCVAAEFPSSPGNRAAFIALAAGTRLL